MVTFDEKALNEVVMKRVRQTPRGMVDRMLKKIKENQTPIKKSGKLGR